MERYFGNLTTKQIKYIDKTNGVVILPIGAVEQHGAHLPLLTDTIIATRALDLTLKQLPDEVKAWALPPMSYGKSNEHVHFPGTITLSAGTLSAVLHDIGKSIARAGFRRFAFLNGHGGNIALLNSVARDIRESTSLMVFCMHGIQYGTPDFSISEKEWKLGLHGGETETSLILELEPDLVHMDQAVTEYPNLPDGGTELFFTGNASVAWLADDWSESGVFGDATLGTAEKGQKLLKASVQNLTKLITVISTFEIDKVNHDRRY